MANNAQLLLSRHTADDDDDDGGGGDGGSGGYYIAAIHAIAAYVVAVYLLVCCATTVGLNYCAAAIRYLIIVFCGIVSLLSIGNFAIFSVSRGWISKMCSDERHITRWYYPMKNSISSVRTRAEKENLAIAQNYFIIEAIVAELTAAAAPAPTASPIIE